MKRLFALLLALCLCVPVAARAEDAPAGTPAHVSQGLSALGLLRGVNEAGDLDLDRSPTRAEALTMLVRALGWEDEALAAEIAHPFTDVAAWADPYVSYAYQNALTLGVSETEFGPDIPASCEMYLTFMLRALGYNDTAEDYNKRDFVYERPYDLAARVGIFPTTVDWQHFTREDVAEVTAASLFAPLKSRGISLGEKLVEEGVFSAEDLAAAFPADPYGEEKELAQIALDAVKAAIPLGLQRMGEYSAAALILADRIPWGNNVALYVTGRPFSFYCQGADAGWTKWNSDSSDSDLWQVEVDPATREVVGIHSLTQLTEEMGETDAILRFTARTLAVSGLGDRDRLAYQDLKAAIARGEISATYTPLDDPYLESVRQITQRWWYGVERTVETPVSTLFVGHTGGIPGGRSLGIDLVFKEGAVRPAGERVNLLPLVSNTGWNIILEPSVMQIHEDTATLEMVYHFDDTLILAEGSEFEQVVHKPGTYRFTVDLTTGEVTEDFTPLEGAELAP